MNYMTQHLLEAIEINKERQPLYSKLTGKKSLKISRTLLFFEELSLISSYPLDTIAKYWQKRNVPVMVHEFIPMEETPDFKESFESDTDLFDTFPKLNTQLIQKEAIKLFKDNNYQGLFDYIDKVISDMQDYPKHYCMIRHVLESIRRGAYLTQMHIERAAQLKVRKPEKFCRYILYNQLIIIHSSKLIDKWAHPIQKDGIPIIYQDVPYIPAKPEKYII